MYGTAHCSLADVEAATWTLDGYRDARRLLALLVSATVLHLDADNLKTLDDTATVAVMALVRAPSPRVHAHSQTQTHKHRH